MRTIVGLLMTLAMIQAHANAQQSPEKDKIISRALEHFWGHARDSKGEVFQPSSDLDRRTVPVSTGIAYRVIDAGEVSGKALWCGLDWDSHYRSLTAAARRSGMSDKQVAYISILHGVVQGLTLRSRSSTCSDDERTEVGKELENSTKLGLGIPDA